MNVILAVRVEKEYKEIDMGEPLWFISKHIIFTREKSVKIYVEKNTEIKLDFGTNWFTLRVGA